MTLAQQARTVLTSWHPDDVEQQSLRDEYIAHIDSFDDAMFRTCVPGHLTASTLIVDHSRERVLLTLHPKVGMWLQMGGHCELSDVSVRAAWHLDVQYVATAPFDARESISDESLDLAWFGVDELPDLTDDALRALVAAALR